MAFDTVAKENAGFNTFGFDTGDNAGAIPSGYAFVNEDAKNATIGDGIRNSYDEGDKNLDGKSDGEVWTGRKIYTESWTDVWTLVKPGTTGLDANAIFTLESAINKNLDPKLHITIASDGKITMANQARDPWKNEYHGYYITNAETDKGDRGAIVIYSNGANGKWGSAHDITNGVVTVTVPGNNVNGKDDYSIVSCYTFTNGYGEVLNMSTGFSNNQIMPNGNGMMQNTPNVQPDIDGPVVDEPDDGGDVEEPVVVAAGLYKTGTNFTERVYSWQELLDEEIIEIHFDRVSINITDAAYSQDLLDGDLVFPNDSSIKQFNGSGFQDCNKLKNVVMGSGMTDISNGFRGCSSLKTVVLPDTITAIGSMAFYNCRALTKVVVTSDIVSIKTDAFEYCESLQEINLPNSLQSIESYAFSQCKSLQSIVLPENLTMLGRAAFEKCTSLQSITIPASVQYLYETFKYCSNLTQVVIQGNNTEIPYNGSTITPDSTQYVILTCPQGTNRLNSSSISPKTWTDTGYEVVGLSPSSGGNVLNEQLSAQGVAYPIFVGGSGGTYDSYSTGSNPVEFLSFGDLVADSSAGSAYLRLRYGLGESTGGISARD
jgi:hypothetical protein